MPRRRTARPAGTSATVALVDGRVSRSYRVWRSVIVALALTNRSLFAADFPMLTPPIRGAAVANGLEKYSSLTRSCGARGVAAARDNSNGISRQPVGLELAVTRCGSEARGLGLGNAT
jgi:hypothetical protein